MGGNFNQIPRLSIILRAAQDCALQNLNKTGVDSSLDVGKKEKKRQVKKYYSSKVQLLAGLLASK